MADIFKLVSIESLKSEDEKTGQQLVEWANDNFKRIISAVNLSCRNKDDFIRILENLKGNSAANETLILSLEMHGYEHGEGLCFADYSSITWSELAPYLRELNRKTQMGLIILSSVCFGSYLCLITTWECVSPFYKFFGPNNEIDPRKILKINKKIIDAILCDKDISAIVEEENKYFIHNNVKYEHFDAGEVFRKVFTDYIKQDLTPEAIKFRTESCSFIDYIQKEQANLLTSKEYNEDYFNRSFARFLMVDINSNLFEKFPITFEDVWKD
jgi:hypothetical protein